MFESILFDVEIDLNLHKTPFADVHHISRFESEKELILWLGATFRIESIESITGTLWYVKLTSASAIDAARLDFLTRYIQNDINNSSSYLSFGNILQDVGEYDQAERFYELLLTELSPKHRDIAAIYTGLGSTIAKAQTNPRRALRYLRQSLTLQIMLPKN
jgi:tetratricopeptide (TPR) repeat protein